MSGGVDSLKTAALLKAQGHDVFGVHMRVLPESRNGRWDARKVNREKEDAVQRLASRLGIELRVVDLREAFDRLVIQPFLTAYRNGLTPNPCTLCNPAVKFGILLEKALEGGVDRLATGHYARVLPPDDRFPGYRLLRGRDPAKDQSYFLFGLDRKSLAKALFPLGELRKDDVRRWAASEGYTDLLSAESQEICFVPSGHYVEFLEERIGDAAFSVPGPILNTDGTVLGEHRGVFRYTVGQRRGLGLPSTEPYYVVAIEPERNAVRVGRTRDLERDRLIVEKVNWVSMDPPDRPIRACVRIRYRHRAAPAFVIPRDDASAAVRFDRPQRAVTPGQAAVFYDGDTVLGGGTIAREGTQG